MQTSQSTHIIAPHQYNPNSTAIYSIDNAYTIHDPGDIRKKLNLLLSKNTLLSITVPGKFATSTLLTTLIGIEGNYVFLDGFQNEQFNKELLIQSNLTATTNIEGIAVKLALTELSGHIIDTAFVLRARIPQSMQWVQRREFRRVKIPINTPVKIQYKNQPACYDVADISVAGLSYITQAKDRYSSSMGQLYTDCNIILPNESVYLANFEIVNYIPTPHKRAEETIRVGCELKQASYRLDTALQHLINQIDFYFNKKLFSS